ncbi:MAG: hypothetical protein NVS4B3_28060 [Gemmatimonadaceae bacterium]
MLRVAIVGLMVAALGGCGSPGGSHPRNASEAPAAVPALAAGRNGGRDPILERADRARVQGDSAASVWVVIVSDFQCPYCGVWHSESYPALVREYVETGKVRMAYLNYPLPMHLNAVPAAEAAMCAGAQQRFWQMHDAVFATQERWSASPSTSGIFDSLATTLGIDLGPWRQCIATHALRSLIDADQERSAAAGVRSTPTFLIGDTQIAGAQPLAQFRQAIDQALAKSHRSGSR